MSVLPAFLRSWLRDVGGRAWLALATVVAGVGFIQLLTPLHKHLSWLTLFVLALVGIVVLGVIAYKSKLDQIAKLRREVGTLNARIQDLESQPARTEVAPPGGATPFVPTVDYQVNALRQVIAKLGQMGHTVFDFPGIESVLTNYQRSDTDPVFEPLSAFSCAEGIGKLLELGEIEALTRPSRSRTATGEYVQVDGGQLVPKPDLGPNGIGWVNYSYRETRR
jgi:outer membrane murein-binding lipoprotein Lpp